ncbi:shikimate kinase [Verrucomicrobiia bacterium DG1235]|nr:shikimate kinase [Verrucomicrobiae bacterium DG1235]
MGRQVAQRMGLDFMDSDHAIEAAEGKSIPEIFEAVGEPAFREMERAFVEGGHASEGCLVSCGGGLAVQPGMMDFLKSRGLVFSLMATAQGIYERTRHNSNRPLLQVEDPLAEIERMLAVRDPIYRQANCCILTEGRSIGEVVGHVCRTYKVEAAQWGR